jgi:hypothetical protein
VKLSIAYKHTKCGEKNMEKRRRALKGTEMMAFSLELAFKRGVSSG